MTVAQHKGGPRSEPHAQYMKQRSLIELLHRAGQAAEALHGKEIGSHGLTARQNTVLQYIAAEDDASQTDICNKTGIDRSTLADMVRRLVKKGLVVRRRTRNDARRYALRATLEGHSMVAAARKALKRTDDKLFAMLNAADRDKLITMLEQLSKDR